MAKSGYLFPPSPKQFLNFLTSVRVFTRIISDNPWCSLLEIFSLRWKYNVTLTHWIPNNSWQESMTISRFVFKWLWNLINFKKLFKLTNRRHIYCSHFVQFTRHECDGHKCSQVDARKYKLLFCFPRLQYSWSIGRYISMYLRLSNSLHSILASVLC